MSQALGFVAIGIFGIFAGKFFKKLAEQPQAKLDEKNDRRKTHNG